MGRFDKAIKKAKEKSKINSKAVEPNNSKAVEPNNSKAVKKENNTEEKIKPVNICVRVDPRLRKYWAIQAKDKETTMTNAMVKGLISELGLPEDEELKIICKKYL